MAEITDSELSFLNDFANMLTDAIDWSQAPQTMQEDYTTFTQLIQGLQDKSTGAMQQDQAGGPS